MATLRVVHLIDAVVVVLQLRTQGQADAKQAGGAHGDQARVDGQNVAPFATCNDLASDLFHRSNPGLNPWYIK